MPGRRPQRSVRCLPVLKENCFFAVNGLCDDVSCWETDPTVHLEGAALRKRRISFQVSLLHVLTELGEVAEYTHEGRGGCTRTTQKGNGYLLFLQRKNPNRRVQAELPKCGSVDDMTGWSGENAQRDRR